MASKEKKTPSRDNTDSDLLRRFKANPLMFIGTFFILALVIVAFVMPSSMGMDGGRGNVDWTFGYYDKEPIGYAPGNYFARYYDMVMRFRPDPSGDDFNANYQIWRDSFQATVIHTAMLQEMKRAGYTAPERVVDLQVSRLPQFQEDIFNRHGEVIDRRFSQSLYHSMDENRRLALWKDVQEDITKSLFQADATGLLRPSAEAQFIGNMAALERSFEMVVFPLDSFPEAEYEAYAYEHPDLFRSVNISMITVGSEREARQVLARIQNGEVTFRDAALEYSTDMYRQRGGEMGIRMAHELSMDISDAAVRETVLSLAAGEFSDVMRTDPDQRRSSWFFLYAEDDVMEADLSDTFTMDRVRSYMRNVQRGRMEDWAIAQAENFIALAGEIGFDPALRQLGMESRSFGPIPLNYGNVDLFSTLASQFVEELSGSAFDDNFWRAAFGTPVNTTSQPVVQGGNVLVFFPAAETRADESSIEGIASTFDSYWLDFTIEQSLYQLFFNSPRLTDNFDDVFIRIFWN